MPYSIVLDLLAHEPFAPSHITGARLQAMFLQLICQANPALATELHDGNALRQYAIGVIRPKLFLPRRREQPAPMRELTVRIASLDDRIYPAITAWALRVGENTPRLRLGRADFQVTRILVTAHSGEPWAGYATFDQLMSQASDQTTFIELEFTTPTCFSQGARDEPLPLPRHVFGGLARRWNAAFADRLEIPIEPPGETGGFLSRVEQHVVMVHPFQFRSAIVDLGGGRRITGFVGRATYRVTSSPMPNFVCIINLLAEAAFFMGLGKKTSYGCGTVRRVK